jgi:hypothetical protein
MNGDMAFVSMETVTKILDEVAEIQRCEKCRGFASNIAKLLDGD